MSRVWNGAKWLSREKRLAIYLRDGCACVWCGFALEDGAQLSLDHLKPHCEGGSDSCRNLVTSCTTCNNVRGNRSVQSFAQTVAAYLNNGITPESIISHITSTVHRNIDINAARSLIAQRGSYSNVLNNGGK